MSGDSGLGRLAHQRMFTMQSLRKGVSSPALATLADDYVLGSPAVVNTTNPNWPLMATSVSLNVDPFNVFPFGAKYQDPVFGGFGNTSQTAPKPIFIDISDRTQDVNTSVGKQYELDLVTSGEATVNILDKDEAFNPSNTGSPYYPNVKIYRQIFDGAMWPPVPNGASVNLLNLNAVYPIDPSFESYTVTGVATTLGGFIQSGPNAPCFISVTNPFSGTKCLAISTIAGTGLENRFLFTVPCIPGQKYTTSIYVTTASAYLLYIGVYDGFNNGTSMNVANTYTRLQVSFTATKPLHLIVLATGNTTDTGVSFIRVDNIQHEPGGVANTFSATGPVIYGLFSGFVERWPASWNFHGTYGMAQITATDGLAALSRQNFFSELYTAILDTSPDFYWPLNDANGAIAYGEKSGNKGPSLVNYVSKYGGSTAPAAGTALGIVGDAGGTGVLFTSQTASTDKTGTIIGTGQLVNAVPFYWPVLASTTWSATIGVWINTSVIKFTPTDDQLITWSPLPGPNPNTISPLSLDITNTGTVQVFYCGATGSSQLFGAGPIVTDKLPHFIVATIVQASGGNTTVELYIDGTLANTVTVTTASLGGNANLQPVTFMAGGFFSGTPSGLVYQQILNGSMAHLALWNRVITTNEITTLWQVGNAGYSGDLTSVRLGRYLTRNQFSIFNLETGSTTLGPSSISSGTAALDADQAIAVSENGNFFIDGFGTMTFQGRNHRYLETTPKYTFGENAAGGEIPYYDSVTYDYDSTLVVNSVTANQVNGISVTVEDAASQSSYGVLSASVSTNTQSSGEVSDFANWLVFTHAQPFQRVSQVEINPSANPALWPVALGAHLGDRVKQRRRTSSGLTMDADYFIERIERFRDSAMNFSVRFQFSPAAANGQPWIIEDAVFGVLDSTSICGF